MSWTIGKRWPKSAPRGDAPARCAYCGVIGRRSAMVRDRSGNLACPDDQSGRDVATLSFLNAQAAAHRDLMSGAPTDGLVSAQEAVTPIPGPTWGSWVPVNQR